MEGKTSGFFVEAQALLDTNSNPVMVVDMEYTIVAVNQAYCQAYGVSREQVIGANCYRISHHNDSPCHQHGEDCPLMSIRGGATSHECMHIHHDGEARPEHVQVRGFLIHDQEGNRYLAEELVRETDAGRALIDDTRLIGSSAPFVRLLEEAAHAAVTSEHLLVKGETGTGKNRLARFIHRQSHYANGPFVTLKCVNVHEAFLGSELFGHERRALPGFTGRRRGLIDDADGGTLYLDEISDLPRELQGRLLNFLETGEYSRVGGKEVLRANVRVISSTRRNPHLLMQQQKLRSDLYYRICGIKLKIPPLRERREDVPVLAAEFMKSMHAHNDRLASGMDAGALAVLDEYAFPGNIRELQNIMKCAANAASGGIIRATDIEDCLPDVVVNDAGDVLEQAAEDEVSMENMEYEHIKHLLETHHGHRRDVANILKISERTLYRKLKKYNLTDIGK